MANIFELILHFVECDRKQVTKPYFYYYYYYYEILDYGLFIFFQIPNEIQRI